MMKGVGRGDGKSGDGDEKGYQEKGKWSRGTQTGSHHLGARPEDILDLPLGSLGNPVNAKDGPNGDAAVNIGGAIKRVKANNVAS